MSETPSERSIPLRWPPSWSDPKLLEFIAGTPINCILDAPAAVAEAARARGLTAMTRDEAAGVVQFLPDPQWPGVRASKQADGADAGPTGAPWVDSNGWAIRLAQALDPTRRVWLESVPEKGTVQNDAGYMLALAEARVFGARWVIGLDERFATGLAGREILMKARWRKMMETIRFFEGRPSTAAFEPRANLAVISDFHGDNEFLGKEFLNMAERRNLLYRIVPRRGTVKSLPFPLSAAVYVDEAPPDAGTAAVLRKFAQEGGLVIASRGSGAAAWGEAPLPAPIPGYTMRAMGKGRITAPEKVWADPFMLAAEVRILIGRRTDVVRMFNEGTVAAEYRRSKDGRAGIIHLVNYSRTSGGDPMSIMSIAVADDYSRARVVSLERPSPEPVKITPLGQKFPEIPVPEFAVYSAIELERT